MRKVEVYLALIYTGHEELDSTNMFVKENLTAYRHGDIICAKRQRQGRGREHKRWFSSVTSSCRINDEVFSSDHEHEHEDDFIYAEHGDLTFSLVLLRAKLIAFQNKFHSFMAQLVTLTWARLLEEVGFSVTIKYPNDLLIAQKKIAGILTETTERQGIHYEIVGIGININASSSLLQNVGQPACSMHTLGLKKNLNPSRWLTSFIEAFPFYYDLCQTEGLTSFRTIFSRYTSSVEFNRFFLDK